TVWKEDRLELALRASKEGIWDWSLERGTMVYSAWVLRFLDYRRADIPHLFEEREKIMDEASAAEVEAALQDVMDEETDLFAAEPRVRTRTGQWKWLRMRGTPVRDDQGKLLRLVGSIIDISKRKEAERSLADEQAFLRTLIDNIPMNVYFKDKESCFVMANTPTAKKMGLLGWKDLVGKSDADFFSKEHADIAAQHEREIMDSGEAQVDVMEHETWEGKEDTWVISTKKAWFDLKGKVKGTFGVTNDVSELVRAQQAQEKISQELQTLNKEAEKDSHLMRLLIDSVPLNVYYKDLDSRFVIVNEAMSKWFGMESPAEVQGKSDRDIFSEEHWRQAEADERKIIETGEPMVGSVEKETWGGKQDTWVMTSKYPWRNEEGEIFGTFGVSSDVTNLVRAQRELKEVASELARKNQEMEEELSLAREVQQALIPENLPSFKNEEMSVSFKHLYRPASELAGDFFEVIPLGGDRVGFFVCDVMGHGVRSALIVSMLRGLIEKQANASEGVSDFLTGLNDGLCHLLEESGISMFATAVFGVIDLEKNSVELGLAGHASPVAVFSDGVRQLKPPKHARGPALGMMEGATYGSVKADLTGLKRMICFTDGLLEAEDSGGEEFGLDRFIEVIERGGRLPLLLERLVKAGIEFSGEETFDDDVCLLGWEVKR
ncbi:PAS domain-containing protein, partial [bacterium]|nr:PAS domain-containing protein [bacterium]